MSMAKSKPFMLKFGCLIGFLIGVFSLYFYSKDVIFPMLKHPMLFSWYISLLLGVVAPLSLVISSVAAFKLLKWGRRLFISLMLWNLFFTLAFHAIIENGIRLPMALWIRDYVFPLVSVFFATDSIVFRMAFDDPWVGFNYWAGFFLRVILCIIPLFCFIRPKIKEQFN